MLQGMAGIKCNGSHSPDGTEPLELLLHVHLDSDNGSECNGHSEYNGHRIIPEEMQPDAPSMLLLTTALSLKAYGVGGYSPGPEGQRGLLLRNNIYNIICSFIL